MAQNSIAFPTLLWGEYFFAEFFTSLFRENVFHASSQKAGILSCAEDSCHTLENYLIDYT